MNILQDSGVVAHPSKGKVYIHKIEHLSKEAQQKITEWQSYKEERDRVGWDEYFLNQAINAASRSQDPQTQCGCIIVSSSKEVIASGYNGLPRDIYDDVYPNLRPAKYPFFIHSEINALLSCARQGKSCIGATAYITAPPCHNCLVMMWQAGIIEVVHGLQKTHLKTNDEDRINTEIFLWLTKDRLTMRSVGV